MKEISAALWMESLKALRSKMLWATMLVFAFVAFMMGMLMLVAMHPEYAGKSAIISAKVSIIAKTDWPSFFGLLTQIILSLGTMGFGIVTSWVFGREYSDRVIKDLLALPVSRLTIVISKFIIIALWCIMLSLIIFSVGLITGMSINLKGWSGEAAFHALKIFMGSSLLTILFCTPVALIASYGRGFLLAIGFVLMTLIITQLVFLGVPGLTPYFPWAIPALYSGIAGPGLPAPGFISYIILGLTCILGFCGTAAWWRYADQM